MLGVEKHSFLPHQQSDRRYLARQGTTRHRWALNGLSSDALVTIQYVDSRHGNTLEAYRALGSPRYPTRAHQFRLDDLIRRDLAVRNDPREVISDAHVRYFGGELSERTLVLGDDARLGETRFETGLINLHVRSRIRACSPRQVRAAANNL